MEWFKKHVDTVIVLGGILSAVLWMEGKFSVIDTDIALIKISISNIQQEVNDLKVDVAQLKTDVAQLKTDISIIKTVLIMHKMMPTELAANAESARQ